jgi:hypothetical protein
MKKCIIILMAMMFVSCAHTKVIWSIDPCEVNLINKCYGFCKSNHSKVDGFVKTNQEYKCSCTKDMEVTFKNVCE